MPAPKKAKTEIVKVRLGKRSYDIVIGENLIAEAGKRIAKLKPGTAVAIVTDGNVAHHHLGTLERSLEAANIRYRSVLLSPARARKVSAICKPSRRQFWNRASSAAISWSRSAAA